MVSLRSKYRDLRPIRKEAKMDLKEKRLLDLAASIEASKTIASP